MKTFPLEQHLPDVVIAVNNASFLLPCDWVCAGDQSMIEKLTLAPHQHLCIPEQVSSFPIESQIRYTLPWQALTLPTSPTRQVECMYSVVVAVSLAVWLGATGPVKIYGMDWGGDKACDGSEYTLDNKEHWDTEKEELRQISKMLNVPLLRILPI